MTLTPEQAKEALNKVLDISLGRTPMPDPLERQPYPGVPIWEFQPGNCTNYELALFPLRGGLDLFVWVNAPPGVQNTTKLSQGSLLPAWWFLDRLQGLRHADGAAILAWMGRHGYQVTMPEGFSAEGLWVGDDEKVTNARAEAAFMDGIPHEQFDEEIQHPDEGKAKQATQAAADWSQEGREIRDAELAEEVHADLLAEEEGV